MPFLLLFVFGVVFLATGTFSILSLLAIILFPLVSVLILKGSLSKKDILITTVIDIFLVGLVIWKGLYSFTPFFGAPDGLFMNLSDGKIVYCGCVFLFPIYLSVLFLVLLISLLGLKSFHLHRVLQKGVTGKVLKKTLIGWAIILIALSLMVSSVYGNYFPYGFYKSHTVENFNKDRNIIQDIGKYFIGDR